MNKIIDDIFSHSKFIKPYLKQILKYGKIRKVLCITNNNNYSLDVFNELGLDVVYDNSLNTYECLFDLVIIINKNNINFDNTYKIIKKESFLFIINNTNELDKKIIDYKLENNFNFVEEFIGDDKWEFLLYKKNS